MNNNNAMNDQQRNEMKMKQVNMAVSPIIAMLEGSFNGLAHSDPINAERLRGMLKSLCGNYEFFLNNFLSEERSSKWIPVEERLPEVWDEYNVVVDLEDGGEPISRTREYVPKDKCWYHVGTDTKSEPVLKWQELPKP